MAKNQEVEVVDMNVADRTAELLEKEFGPGSDEIESVPRDARDEAILSGRPRISRDGVGERVSDANLMPELKGLFKDRDYLVKEFFPQGLGDMIDTGLDADLSRNVKAKKIAEPESLYDQQLDPRKERLFYYFFLGQLRGDGQAGDKTVGDEIAIQVKRLAAGSGVPVVAFLRQKLWRHASRRMTMALPGAPRDRQDSDDDVDSDEHRRLVLLLEDDVVECIKSIGRTNDVSNVTALRFILKDIHDKGYVAFN